MTKTQTCSNRYLITPSLLNAWGYIWECAKAVKEAESDILSLEDKIYEAQQKAVTEFISRLTKEESTPNKYMQDGIDFENACYNGETCISPIIAGGSYQIVGKKT